MHSFDFLATARVLTACIVVVRLFDSAPAVRAQETAGDSGELQRVQKLSDELRVRLEIDEPVRVTIDAVNPLLMSVEPVGSGAPREFRLRVEAEFAKGLSDSELLAAVAHELGHVWIFTHHPFLQTEQLANDIAMRIVSRDILAQMYERVWSLRGKKGDLERFLGPQPQAGLVSGDPHDPSTR
jgi:hypothetical protein